MNRWFLGALFVIVCSIAPTILKAETQVTRSELAQAVSGNSHFAFDLYNKVAHDDNSSNIFFSPFSISDALAMTYAGSREETEKQMAEVMHFTFPQERLHEIFSSVIGTMNDKGKPYQLKIANALWGQKDYRFLEEFKKLVKKYYQGGFRQVDFPKIKESQKIINQWVEGNTASKIKELLRGNDTDALTRLVLTNAIYFKSDWATQFENEMTLNIPFTTGAKETVDAPMMRRTGKFRYCETDTQQILEMPYKENQLSMVLVLPKKRGKGEDVFEATLFRSLMDQLRVEIVQVSVPKFKFETRYYVQEVLSEMGMPDAFDPDKADFSGMTGSKNLYIKRVIHQAFIEVDEKGSEATAATAVVMAMKSASPPKPKLIVFLADHPFMFFIVQKLTGTILFMGRVSNPTKS